MAKHAFTFDSVESFVREAQRGANGEGAAWTRARQSKAKNADFSGTASFAEAARLALAGWPEGRARMVKGVEAVASSPAFERAAALFFDVAGAYPVAALAAAGVPECMVSPAPVSERARPIVRLAVSGSVSCNFKAEEIFAYGAALLGVIDALESAEFRVELNVIFPAKAYNGDKLSVAVRVKDAPDALDLDRAAFILAHASTLRRLVFGVMEANLSCDVWGGGYGSPRLPEYGLDGDEGVVFLPGPQQFKAGSRELKTPESAFAALAPSVLELLRDRYAEFPPLQFGPALAA